MPTEYLVPVNWTKFQQRIRSGKPSEWIKLYTELLDRPDYLLLPPGARSLLIEIWLLYARYRKSVPRDPDYLRTRLRRGRDKHVTSALETLISRGFLRIERTQKRREEKRREKRSGTLPSQTGPQLSLMEELEERKSDPEPVPMRLRCSRRGCTEPLRGDDFLCPACLAQNALGQIRR